MTRLINKKVSGNSLVITTVIALVIALLCSAVILLAYFNRQWSIHIRIDEKLSRNLTSATNLILGDTSSLSFETDEILDLYGEETDTVIIKKKPWSIFNIAYATATAANWSKSKGFIYGCSLPPFMEASIYLGDHQRPLSLVGDTRLVGKAYLPKEGVKASYINQRGFSYSKLVQGQVERSGDTLPGIDTNRLEYLHKVINLSKDTSSFEKIASIPDSLTQLFSDAAFIIAKTGTIILANTKLKGHVIVTATDLIEVEKTAILEDVLLVAPSITFKNGFSGTVNAIATNSIKGENGCTFSYPSSIVLIKEKKNVDQPKISIGTNCVMYGIIFSYAGNEDRNKTLVEIGKSTVVRGLVFVSGFLDLKAAVYGTVATDFFIYKTQSSTFENYLVDVEINREGLSPNFISSPIFKNYRKNKILRWVQ